jgi:hypothetical protein
MFSGKPCASGDPHALIPRRLDERVSTHGHKDRSPPLRTSLAHGGTSMTPRTNYLETPRKMANFTRSSKPVATSLVASIPARSRPNGIGARGFRLHQSMQCTMHISHGTKPKASNDARDRNRVFNSGKHLGLSAWTS